MQYKFYKLFTSLFVLFLFLSLYVNPAIAKKNATLNKLRGNVNVFKPGETKGVKGKIGMLLLVGDKVVTTGKDSRADIIFPDGDIVRVMPDTGLIIEESYFKKKIFRVQIKLFAGKIFNIVFQKYNKESKYMVKTPTAVTGVRGTIWSAETSEGGEDLIMVKEGKVAVINPEVAPEKEIMVSELMKTIVKENTPPSHPIPMTPEEIAMFDILDDLLVQQIEEMRDEIKDNFAEDMLEQ